MPPSTPAAPLRSMLFVPADSDRKLAKGRASNADALILDLEDAVAASERASCRARVHDFLRAEANRSRQQLWVRITPVDEETSLADLAAIMAGAPDGIVLPKAHSAAQAVELGHYLGALEAREGLVAGSTRILVVATETAQSLFSLGSYVGASDRLYGLTWGAEDLSAALGAISNRRGDAYDGPYDLARSLCLAAARAAGAQPVDAVFPAFRDLDGLRAEAEQARRSGFSGKIAIHPDQVDVINAAFAPTADEIAFARRVVETFAAQPDAGVVAIDGRMLDRPHLRQAEQILALAER